ncbi:MAG: sugar porter family MFS transporter, partial [Prevotellaceae bacterium]|nr:sugar porter family MFS transporter [Prevotellaceae bacterium]
MKKQFLYFICSVAAMGGLLFGYDWVVIGGAKPFYEAFFGIADDPVMQGLAMTTANIGCLFGAMVAGLLADRYGRKPLLITASVLFLTSAVATGAFNNFTMFNLARFWGGIGIGLASALSPMYIAEVAPANIRGRLVSLNQMTIVLGILGAQVVNMLLAQNVGDVQDILNTWNGQWGWRWMFWAEAVPAFLFLLLAFFIPESPRYLAMKGQTATVAENIDKVGFTTLFEKKYTKVLILGLVIAVFQQWCGTNVIFNYAEEIFAGAGYNVDSMFINIVVTGIANVLFTFVAIYTVEKLGRRKLMLIGAGGLGLIYLTLGTCYFMHVEGIFMVILVVLAISCYAMTLGPITWVLLSEIFPDKIRGVAMATCTFALWVGCCTLTFTFPSLNAALGTYGTFWIYSGVCLCSFIYLYKVCPETKGKTFEELEKELS